MDEREDEHEAEMGNDQITIAEDVTHGLVCFNFAYHKLQQSLPLHILSHIYLFHYLMQFFYLFLFELPVPGLPKGKYSSSATGGARLATGGFADEIAGSGA